MKQSELSEVPLYSQQCNLWYFEQPYFIYNGHKFNIIGTDISTNNVIHDIRLPNGIVIQMSTLDIVNKYKMLKTKETLPIPIKEIKINNQQQILDL